MKCTRWKISFFNFYFVRTSLTKIINLLKIILCYLHCCWYHICILINISKLIFITISWEIGIRASCYWIIRYKGTNIHLWNDLPSVLYTFKSCCSVWKASIPSLKTRSKNWWSSRRDIFIVRREPGKRMRRAMAKHEISFKGWATGAENERS